MKAPERNAGEAHLALTSCGLSARSSSGAPTSRARWTISSQTASCCGAVAA